MNGLEVRNTVHPTRDLEDKWREKLNHVCDMREAVKAVAWWPRGALAPPMS